MDDPQPSGTDAHISDGVGGSVSDNGIVNKSVILDELETEDIISVDRSFIIRNILYVTYEQVCQGLMCEIISTKRYSHLYVNLARKI